LAQGALIAWRQGILRCLAAKIKDFEWPMVASSGAIGVQSLSIDLPFIPVLPLSWPRAHGNTSGSF